MAVLPSSREYNILRTTHGQADLEPADIHQAGRDFRHHGMALAAQWLVGAVNIAGKPYLTDKSLGDFLRRVEAGEFAKPPRVPTKCR